MWGLPVYISQWNRKIAINGRATRFKPRGPLTSLGSKEYLKLGPMSSQLGPMSPKFFIDVNLGPLKPQNGPAHCVSCASLLSNWNAGGVCIAYWVKSVVPAFFLAQNPLVCTRLSFELILSLKEPPVVLKGHLTCTQKRLKHGIFYAKAVKNCLGASCQISH